MNQPTTPNTVEDFLPLPEHDGVMEISIDSQRMGVANGYTAETVREAILADRAQRPVAAVGGTLDDLAIRPSAEPAGQHDDDSAAKLQRQMTQSMADCMDMVRSDLIEMGIIDKTVAPMFIPEAVAAPPRSVLVHRAAEPV